jgi:hypothetical protein
LGADVDVDVDEHAGVVGVVGAEVGEVEAEERGEVEDAYE